MSNLSETCNTNTPKISVIMPVYNTKEEYLRPAIESILQQTFKNFEFLILNDGSSDETVEKVIKSYNDERIKYFYKKNTGIADTLNFGLAQAQGELIARMDSDDISLPERFAKQVEFLDAHPEISVLSGNYKIFPDTKVVVLPQRPKYLDFLEGCKMCHPAVMFRKVDFERYNLKYNPEYKCEDYELWSRAIRYFKFANLNEVILHYRWHDTNLSKPTEIFKTSVLRVQENMLDFLTDDEKLRQKLLRATVYRPKKMKLSLKEKIFSFMDSENGRHNILTILGVHIKIKKRK